MSGGSYRYLCSQDARDLLGGSHRSELRQMRERLLAAGALDAAAQTDAVVATIQQAADLVQMRVDALHGVWKAVEWVDSCDWGPEDLDEALAEYRGGSGESTTEMPPNPGVTPEDPRLSTKAGER